MKLRRHISFKNCDCGNAVTEQRLLKRCGSASFKLDNYNYIRKIVCANPPLTVTERKLDFFFHAALVLHEFEFTIDIKRVRGPL
jgi:hypothetical protein